MLRVTNCELRTAVRTRDTSREASFSLRLLVCHYWFNRARRVWIQMRTHANLPHPYLDELAQLFCRGIH